MTITASTRLQLFGETDAQVIRLSQRHHAPAITATSLPASHRTGTWTVEEHNLFLDGLNLCPNGPWDRIALHIGTRTRRQVMTHAQKYRQRLQRRANRVPTHVMPTEDPHDIRNVPTSTEVRPRVISVVVSPPIPSVPTTGEMESEIIELSLPDVFIRDGTTAVFDADMLCVQLPPIDVDNNFPNLLSTSPMFENFEMTSPGLDVEPLEFYDY